VTYLVAILAIAVVGEMWLLWRVARALGALERFADRLAQLSGALNLLTETAESGFVSFAGVMHEAMQPAGRRRAPRRSRALAAPAAGASLPPTSSLAESALRLQMAAPDRQRVRYVEDR
jgi:hypothetical protein